MVNQVQLLFLKLFVVVMNYFIIKVRLCRSRSLLHLTLNKWSAKSKVLVSKDVRAPKYFFFIAFSLNCWLVIKGRWIGSSWSHTTVVYWSYAQTQVNRVSCECLCYNAIITVFCVSQCHQGILSPASNSHSLILSCIPHYPVNLSVWQ